MQKKKIDKSIIDFLKGKVTYDKDNDIIYIHGNKTNEYNQRVLVETINVRFNKKYSIEEIKEILSDEDTFEIVDNSSLNELKDLINGDDNIKEDDFQSFLK